MILLAGICSVFSNTTVAQLIKPSLLDGLKTITISDPYPERQDPPVLLTEVCNKLDIVRLESNGHQNGSLHSINRYKNRYYAVFSHNLCCYDNDGKMLFRLGDMEELPGAYTRPTLFAVDFNSKEICIIYAYTLDNVNSSYKMALYDLNGNCKRMVEYGDNLKCGPTDFAYSNKNVCFVTSAHRSMGNNKGIDADLYIFNGKEVSYRIPYNSENKLDGQTYGGSIFYLSNLKRSITYHYPYSDTIYSINKRNMDVSGKYVVNFGDDEIDPDFHKMNTNQFSQYALDLGSKKGLITNVLETDKLLYFKYRYENYFTHKSVIVDSSTGQLLYRGTLYSGIPNLRFEELVGGKDNALFFQIDMGFSAQLESYPFFSAKSIDNYKSAKEGDIIILVANIKDATEHIQGDEWVDPVVPQGVAKWRMVEHQPNLLP